MSESKRTTRSSAAAKATSATTPSKRSLCTNLAKPIVGPFWCDAVVHCAESGEYLTFHKLTKKYPNLKAMCPASLSNAERKLYINAWNDTIVRTILKGNDAEKRKALLEEARAKKQVHLSLEVDELGDEVEALGGKVETIDGEVKIQGAQISNVVNRVGNLEELVKGGDQRSHSTKAPVDFVPPSTDKKPPADDRETKQPSPISSPRNLLTTFNGGSTGDGVGVSKTAAPAATAPSGISIADLPLDDQSFFAEYYRAHPEKVDAVLSAAFAAAEPFMESDDDDDGDDGDDDDGSDDSSTGRYGVPEAVRGLAKGISKVAQSQADQVQAQVATQEQVNTLRRQVNTLEHQQRAKNGGGFFGGLFSDA